jgi:hypothetical protein
MAVYQDKLILEILTKNTGAVNELSKFSSAGAQMGKLQTQGVNLNHEISNLKESLGEGSVAFQTLSKSMKQTYTQGSQMERLGPMFAFMFGGMQMQRLGQGILRFVLPSMEKLDNYVSDGTKRVNAMNASFQFLKFSMFETLTQTPMFKNFVDLVITAANWLSKVVAEHPWLVKVAAAFGAFATAVGTLAFGAGIFNQFAMMAGYLGMGKKASSLSLKKGITALKEHWNTVFGAMLVAKAGLDLYNYATGKRELDWGNIIWTAITGGLGVGFMLASGTAGVIATTTILVGLAFWKEYSDANLKSEIESYKTGIQKNWMGIVSDVMSPKGSPIGNLFDLTNLVAGKGVVSSPTLDASNYEAGISEALSLYQSFLESQERIQNNLNDEDLLREQGVDYIKDQKNQLSIVNSEMSKIESLAQQSGGTFLENLKLIQFQAEAEKEHSTLLDQAKSAADEKAAAEKLANDAVNEQYSEQLSSIANSDEKTEDFTKNMKTLLDLFTGDNMLNSIANLQLIDSTWIDAQTHLTEFATKLDEWAAKVVTKTVKIKYEGSSNKDAGSTPDSKFISTGIDSLKRDKNANQSELYVVG